MVVIDGSEAVNDNVKCMLKGTDWRFLLII